MADDKKPSGSFYRKRKLQKSKEDEKQAKALRRFFSTPASVKIFENDNANVDVDELSLSVPVASNKMATGRHEKVSLSYLITLKAGPLFKCCFNT